MIHDLLLPLFPSDITHGCSKSTHNDIFSVVLRDGKKTKLILIKQAINVGSHKSLQTKEITPAKKKIAKSLNLEVEIVQMLGVKMEPGDMRRCGEHRGS